MTTTAPLFSVVIPTYNRAALVAEALASVWAQRWTDFEVIAVDDGSTDGTVRVLEDQGDRLRLFRQANRGPGNARNAGAGHARGRYLAFLDSDDVWFPWTLETYAEIIARHSQPALVAGTPTYFSTADELRKVEHAETRVESFPDYYASNDDWRWWGASAFVISREAFAAVGGFTAEWINGEDADLAMRLGVSRGFVHVTAPSTFGYRKHAASEMANFDRTLSGAWRMVEQEAAGVYPGGASRAPARRQILGRHLRSVMLECLTRHRLQDGWRLYRATFGWHLSLGRWRFLFAFPALALRSLVRS